MQFFLLLLLPSDFMFLLTKEELEVLRSQFVTTKLSKTRTTPYAFTEHGVVILICTKM
ncbi:MAG: ORF6N domain-containing protein [Halarcobacter sp.]